MSRCSAALVTFLGIAVLIPVFVLVWYSSAAAGPFDLYPRLAAAYHEIGLDMNQIQRNQLNHLIRACWVEPQLFWTLAYAGAPTLAALAALPILGGWAALRDFAGRYHPLRGMTAQRALVVYSTALAASLGFILVMLVTAKLAGVPFHLPALGWRYAVTNFLFTLVINQGALLEEGGWRGFLQPLLQSAGRRPIAAAIVVGLIWAAWHVPRDIMQGTPLRDPIGYSLQLTSFAVYCVSTAIIHAWLLTFARGSLWPSIAFHGSGNYAQWLLGASTSAADASALVGILTDNVPALLGAALVIIFWRPTTSSIEPVTQRFDRPFVQPSAAP